MPAPDLIASADGAYLDLNELTVLAKRAQPGPWTRSSVRQKISEECIGVAGPDGLFFAALPVGRTDLSHAEAMRDAAFMAAANPLTVLSLINEIKRLRMLHAGRAA